ncbi:MAG: hypothetical protein ACOC6G_00785 [Thermoproteota archaeon]
MERKREEREKKKPETMDIYEDEEREKMLKADEITAAEEALMRGRDMEVTEKKKDLMLEKKDTKSVELAKKEYQED